MHYITCSGTWQEEVRGRMPPWLLWMEGEAKILLLQLMLTYEPEINYIMPVMKQSVQQCSHHNRSQMLKRN